MKMRLPKYFLNSMRKTSELNYAFSVGKIRALEKFLIRNEVFEEAIDADLSEALRLFTEADLYSDELINVRTSSQLEQILSLELSKVKKIVCSLLRDEILTRLVESENLQCMQLILTEFDNGFIFDYFNYAADMHNIKTFLRLRVLKDSEDRLKELLSCEGFIKKEDFIKIYNQDLSVLLNKLEYVHKPNQVINYASFLAEGILNLEKRNSFLYLEKAINNFLIQVLKPAKYICFGPEPVLAYYFAKVNEINLIRMVILAKLNNLSANIVKERLNLVYA